MDSNICILYFGSNGTISLHILEQLASDGYLRTYNKLLYALGEVCIESVEYLATILGICNPE